jgi:hypothetical protein
MFRQVLFEIACLDWCFGYLDNGRLGDQKYLDDWMTRFSGIHNLQHLGGGVAPWNFQQYNFFIKGNKVFGHLKDENKSWPLVFYHFHGFCLISPAKYLSAPSYDLSLNAKEAVCEPYFRSLKNNIELVNGLAPDFNFGYKEVSAREKFISWLLRFSFARLIIKVVRKIR